jgi:putative DNA primase/helicase
VKPKVVDKDLEAKLLIYEGPQILRWMIAGTLDWQVNGLIRPQRIIEATEQYFAGQDEIGRWIEEHCVEDPDALTRLQVLLDAFWEFLIDEDLVSEGEVKMPKKSFKAELTDRGFREGRNDRMRGIKGLRLRTREEAMNASQ